MIDHVAVQVQDPDSPARFSVDVLAPLGVVEAMRYPAGDSLVIGLAGPDEQPRFYAPREWPEGHEGYYGVFLRDLDGNDVEAVCHRPG